jgi:C1A family cysteine protease
MADSGAPGHRRVGECRPGVVLPDGPGRAGHAVLAVGAASVTGRSLEPQLRDGEGLLCVRNSWGNAWGRDGHALMTEAAIGDCLILGFALDAP